MKPASYNTLIIFDLDGVLIRSRELHYRALNKALNEIDPKYVITEAEHLSTYDALPTKKKLEMLTQSKNFPVDKYDLVYKLKQKYTLTELPSIITRADRDKFSDLFYTYKNRDYKIAIASNAVRSTVVASMFHLGISQFVDFFVSNEDVVRAKPFPEMYWECMKRLNAVPDTTWIIEDSHYGRQAVLDAKCNLIAVENPDDVTYEKIQKAMSFKKEYHHARTPWIRSGLNVVIPMAGAGSRFAAAGYTFPKPLISVDGKPMIQVVVDNLNVDAKFHFIVNKQHYKDYALQYLLPMIAPNCTITVVDDVTQGAACTTLLAKQYINNDQPLIIANSDQFMEWNSSEAMYSFDNEKIDGGILTFKSIHPKWSFAKTDRMGFVEEVAEKKPISDNATVGVYFWRKGSDYVKYAEQMIAKNIRVNNEFYVCPVFNEAIADGKKIKIKQIDKMWGLGTPEDLTYFLENYKGLK